jgi:SAM-dependent methyltransferase
MSSQELGEWHSQEFVATWVGDDTIADMLELPRKLSALLVRDAEIPVARVLDLGSGHGPYLARFLRMFPEAQGTWFDYSEAMEELARAQLAEFGDRVEYVVGDVERLHELELEQADVIVTSRALHHFSPESLQRIYRRCCELTTPGGFIFNLDHIGTPGDWEGSYRRIRDQITEPRKAEAPHRHDFPFYPPEEHRAWMELGGYADADVPWRLLFTTLIAARRPA